MCIIVTIPIKAIYCLQTVVDLALKCYSFTYTSFTVCQTAVEIMADRRSVYTWNDFCGTLFIPYRT